MAWKEFVVVRDREQRKTLKLEKFDDEEKSQTRYEELIKQYPQPRYEVVITIAKDRKSLLRDRPRYAR